MEAKTPPKLSFHPLPHLRHEPPGMATPPIHVPATIPFQWEEAPGKPKRHEHHGGGDGLSHLPPRPRPVRSLLLPPRLQALESPLPNTMLDGAYPTERGSVSFRTVSEEKRERGKGIVLAGWSWKKGRKQGGRVEGVSPTSSASSSGSSLGSDEREEDEEHESATMVRISRSNSVSIIIPYRQKSHYWLGNLCGALRQAIQRRKDRKV